jgi:CRISPR-associated protein Cmr3
MSIKTTWRFELMDTWFFRESRPHSPVGGSELGSVFPPPARTLAGAIRTLMGECLNADWNAFKSDPAYTIGGLCLRRELGLGDDLGALKLSGPWLLKGTERLYPVPAYLLGKQEGERWEFVQIKIGNTVCCDLGAHLRLPMLEKGEAGFKPLERAWLTRCGLEAVLGGGIPSPSDVILKKALFNEEPRLGIARNNERRTVKQEMLYQTRHIRPKHDVDLAVEVDVEGGNPRLHPDRGLSGWAARTG